MGSAKKVKRVPSHKAAGLTKAARELVSRIRASTSPERVFGFEQAVVDAMATNEHFSARAREPAVVRRLAEVVIPRWEELRRSLGPHPLGRVRPPR